MKEVISRTGWDDPGRGRDGCARNGPRFPDMKEKNA
jgi:hypothetical protein